MNRIKSGMILLVVLSMASLSAMENKKSRGSLCLLERQRLAKEISLDRDTIVHQKRLEEQRRNQTVPSYDGSFEYSTVMQPVDAEKFRKIIGQ